MRRSPRFGVSAILASTLALVHLGGCAGTTPSESETADPMADGEMVYTTPLTSNSSFSCSTCHALQEPAADGLRRPGHPIGDATLRGSWKNGLVASFREAANSCLTEWMNAEPWSETDTEYVALRDFLDDYADSNDLAGEAITISVVSPPADVSGGDAAAGQTLFNGSCMVCHGTDAGGTLRGPPLAGRALESDYIAQRVRTSGRGDSAVYDGLTGGIMPFWGADRLSDDELRDVVAFVSSSDPVEPVDPGPVEPGMGPGKCEATHAKVGWVADLKTKFHMVSGQARIVDDCTIVLEDFDYDGSGIDVRAYVAPGGDYTKGTAIGPQLLKADGYEGATVMLPLPDGLSLDDVDGLSIWCVAVGVSFGDGLFHAPGS